ncbi:FAD-dependent thymidylate synthase [Candidatus Woesearchaeota archaeon]|nr:MAG: FAD-dependent thymidylate synthase [Candidatus Woesearchaeota archaeon]
MPENFSEEEKKLLSRFVTNSEGDVFCIKNLPEEVVAVLFAYYSRSANTFRENLLSVMKQGDIQLSHIKDIYDDPEALSSAKEKAAKFHEKWVLNYGHSSIAEHSDIKFALHNISNVFTKIIEDNRLGRFTEKSSRYVVFDKDAFYKPKIIMNSEFRNEYLNVMQLLFGTYEKLLEPMKSFIKQRMPQKEGVSDRAYEASVKAKACDNIRYLLPAATLTSMGMSLNARAAAHAIRKLLSNPLEEAQDIGRKMLEEGRKICPTLLKYADYNKYIAKTNSAMFNLSKDLFKDTPSASLSQPVKIVNYDTDAEDKLIASILYQYCSHNFDLILDKVRKMSNKEKENILDEYLKRMDNHDYPLRALEHVNFTMEMIMDLGAFRDVQRHRIATQTVQLNTCNHGFEIPDDIIEAGFKEEFENAMKKAKELFDKMKEKFPLEAQYVVPYAFKKQMLFTWNLRELEHFIRLRSGEHGHISYRRIAQKCHEEIEKVFPLLAKYLRVDKNEYYLGRLKSEIRFDKKLKRKLTPDIHDLKQKTA